MEKSDKKNTLDSRRKAISARDIVPIALMTAACVVGRTTFQFIPNVQPMTAIFIIISMQKGAVKGYAVTILSIFATNIYMGMGTWTISQLIAYSAVVFASYVFGKSRFFRRHLVMQAVFAAFCGFLYGFAVTVIEAQIYGIKAFLPYYIQGLSFDVLHALGNGVFYLILAPIFAKLLKRYWP